MTHYVQRSLLSHMAYSQRFRWAGWFKIQEDVQPTRTNSYFDLIGKLFNVAVFPEMLQIFPFEYHEPQGSPALLTHDPVIINEFIARLYYLGGVTVGNTSDARKRIVQTVWLIDLIQTKYHLK